MEWADSFLSVWNRRHKAEVKWVKAWRKSNDPDKEAKLDAIESRAMAGFKKEKDRRKAVLDALGRES